MANLVRFYHSVGVATSLALMTWATVGKNFEQQWEAILEKEKALEPEVPKISKMLPALKWIDAMMNIFVCVYGVQHSHLHMSFERMWW